MKRSKARKKLPQKWRLIDRFDVRRYRCGIRAREMLVLKKTLHVRDHQGKQTGQRYNAGGRWLVLFGSRQDPGVVFLRDTRGDKHTWDDDASIFEWFRREEVT